MFPRIMRVFFKFIGMLFKNMRVLVNLLLGGKTFFVLLLIAE